MKVHVPTDPGTTESSPVSDALPFDDFLDIGRVINVLLLREKDVKSHKNVPKGQKKNVFFLVKDELNIRRQNAPPKSDFPMIREHGAAVTCHIRTSHEGKMDFGQYCILTKREGTASDGQQTKSVTLFL